MIQAQAGATAQSPMPKQNANVDSQKKLTPATIAASTPNRLTSKRRKIVARSSAR